jgi:Restriction endonuclease
LILAYQAARFLRRWWVGQRLLMKAERCVRQSLPAIVIKRDQLVYRDAYGRDRFEKWDREISQFILNQIKPSLKPLEQKALSRDYDEVVRLVQRLVDSSRRTKRRSQAFSEPASWQEFETFCAEELKRSGWDARLSPPGADQGIDVIAEKNGVRVVLQCKHYARPVGNKAVQEAVAARAHERADFGVVVSKSDYTVAARQLAETNRIHLLHHHQLRDLYSRLRQRA